MLLVDAHDALMLDMNQFVDEYIRQTPFIAINSPTMQAKNENNANEEDERPGRPSFPRYELSLLLKIQFVFTSKPLRSQNL